MLLLPLRILLLALSTPHCSCHHLKQLWECCFVSLQSVIKNTVNDAESHPMERQPHRNITVRPHSAWPSELAPCDFWPFPKVKMAIKVNILNYQDIQEAMTAQQKILTKEDFQTCFGKRWNQWTQCAVRGSILKEINDTVSFAVIVIQIEIFFQLHLVSIWKKCSATLAIEEMQIKSTLRFHPSQVIMNIIKNTKKQLIYWGWAPWRERHPSTLLIGMYIKQHSHYAAQYGIS